MYINLETLNKRHMPLHSGREESMCDSFVHSLYGDKQCMLQFIIR